MAENADLKPEPLGVVRIIARLNVGGPAIQASLLTSGLNDRMFRTTLVTGIEGEREGNMLDLASGEGFTKGVKPVVITSLGRKLSPLDDVRALVSIVRLLREVRPDIVHTHTAKAGTLGRLAAWLTRVPVIVHTFHGNVFTGYFSSLTSRLIILLERFLARISTAVIAITDSQLGELVAAGIPRDKIRLIPLGIPLGRLRPEARSAPTSQERRRQARQRLGISDDSIVVGFVARLVPVKNPALLVRAVARLHQANSRILLVVVGDGELREEVVATAKDLDLPIKMLGWRDDMDQIYPAFDVVALSSRNEGSPVALIEAMAAGVPVASTKVGGVADLLEHGAFGELARETPDSLAAAISRAIESPGARIRDAQTHVLSNYSAERLITEITDLYLELLQMSRNSFRQRDDQKRSD